MLSIYKIIRPIIFCLDAEKCHNLAIKFLKYFPKFATLFCYDKKYHNLQNNIWNIDFDNPIGLAAGFDKNAEAVIALNKFGFGFIEVGTSTPKPQKGNPKPRIFRLKQDNAIINRLGFNNLGSDIFIKNIDNIWRYFTKLNHRPIIGVNIGKNKDTKDFFVDYDEMLSLVYNKSSYITINISSPNTKNLRDIQKEDNLADFLQKIMAKKNLLKKKCNKEVPILLKIAPDIDKEEQEKIANTILKNKIDGIIIANTTIDRNFNLKDQNQQEIGGLSGGPLFNKSNQILTNFYQLTKGKVPIIAAGGVSNAQDAYEKIKLGASLVQIYSAFIYQGFGLTEKIKKDLSKMLKDDGFDNVKEAIGCQNKTSA